LILLFEQMGKWLSNKQINHFLIDADNEMCYALSALHKVMLTSDGVKHRKYFLRRKNT